MTHHETTQPIRSTMFRALVFVLVAAVCLVPGVAGQQPKFFRDDPLTREPETEDASKVQEWDINLSADILLNLFSTPGDPVTNQPARNVNTTSLT